MNAKEFGKKIRSLRIRKGLTLRQVGKRSQINSSYISSLEHGKRLPKVSTLFKLSKGLNISSNMILHIAGIKFPKTNNDIDLDEIFNSNQKIFYNGKPISKETLKYIKRLLGDNK